MLPVIFFWRLLAVLCVALGVIGVVLPVMPTVPFLLVAAAAASRGWPALDRWLVAHPLYGKTIVRWRERGAVPRRAKWLATIGMSASSVLIWMLPLPLWLRIAVPSVMLVVGVWLWRRPEE